MRKANGDRRHALRGLRRAARQGRGTVAVCELCGELHDGRCLAEHNPARRRFNMFRRPPRTA